MTQITWKIEKITTTQHAADDGTITHANVVHEVYWRLWIGEKTAYGSETLPFDPANEFTAWDDLTEDQVVDWVRAAIGDERLERIIATLTAEPDAPPPLPWGDPQSNPQSTLATP